MSELDPLPDDVQALLAMARDGAPPPPAGAEAAVLSHVSATVGVPIAAAATSTLLGGLTKPLVALALAGVVAVGVVSVVGLIRRADPATAPPARAEATVLPTPATPVDAPPPSPAAAPVAGPVVAPAPPAVAAPAPTTDTPVVRPVRAAEGATIERAREALARGDADAALRALEEHQRVFGARGRLVEERHALMVVALSHKGDAARARSAADAFARLYPESLFGETVRAAVAASSADGG